MSTVITGTTVTGTAGINLEHDLIKVGVAAESMALRIGLREVINNLPEISVVAAANHSDELRADECDVIVLAQPTTYDSLESTRPILFLTDNPGDLERLSSQDTPAWGVLPVNASEDELAIAIRALAEGLWIGAPALVHKLLTRPRLWGWDEPELSDPVLTSREIEVLQLAARGLANKQIALNLGISEHTIKFHLSSLYAKLGAASRTEAVRAGVRRGLVDL